MGCENISDIGALVKDLRARGFMEKEEARAVEAKKLQCADKKTTRGEFSYYFKVDNDDNHPENNIGEQDIIDELLKNGFTALEAMDLQSQYSAPEHTLQHLFKKEGVPHLSPAYCGSEQGMLVIDPFGRLYSCWDQVAVEGAAVGLTDEQTGRFLMNFSKAKWRTRTSDLMPACEVCPYVFICRSGCASRAFAEHGSYFREHCGETKSEI